MVVVVDDEVKALKTGDCSESENGARPPHALTVASKLLGGSGGLLGP